MYEFELMLVVRPNLTEEVLRQIIEKIEAQGNTDKNPIDKFPCKFFSMIIILLIQAIMTHIMKPVSTFLQIILLTRITDIKTDEQNASSPHSISDGVIALGWLILFYYL